MINFFSELGPVSVDWRQTFRKPTGCVNRTPTQRASTDAHSVSQHTLHRLTTFHHANTRGSRAGRLRIAHLCVPKQLSSTCHVPFLAAPDTDHKHKFSLTHLPHLSFRQSHQHTQDLWYTIHTYPVEVPRQSGGSTQIPSLTSSWSVFAAVRLGSTGVPLAVSIGNQR